MDDSTPRQRPDRDQPSSTTSPDIELGKGRVVPGSEEGGNTGGLVSGVIDGTIGHATEQLREKLREIEELREQLHQRDSADMPDPNAALPSDMGAASIGAAAGPQATSGMNTSDARGRGSAVAGSVGDGRGGGNSGGGTGGLTDVSGVGSDISSYADNSGINRASDITPVAGGVSVSGGRGSDMGDADHSMSNDMGAMSGGTFGGTRESDTGGGLSGGMRSATAHDVSGATGGSTGDTTNENPRDPAGATDNQTTTGGKITG